MAQQVFASEYKVIVDTREQAPLFMHRIIRRKLDEGDYNLVPLEDKYIFERKASMDMYSSITHNHIRFFNMLLRSRLKGKRAYIFVECPAEDFFEKRFRGGSMLKMKPVVLRKIVATMEEKYGVVVVWCQHPLHAKQMLLATFDMLFMKEFGMRPDIISS